MSSTALLGGFRFWFRARLPLNPLGAFTERGEAALSYQVLGQQVGTSYRTTLEFFDADTSEKSVLTLTFDERAESTFREVQRTVGSRQSQAGALPAACDRERCGRTSHRDRVVGGCQEVSAVVHPPA